MLGRMSPPEEFDDDLGDEAYFEERSHPARVFDSKLLRRPLTVLPARKPLILAPDDTVSEATRAMQREHRGCVVVTEDGTPNGRLLGIFTERDVLYRIVDRGRNPATLPMRDVMTAEPECLLDNASVAWVLNRMSAGGFRHVPVVDAEHRPVFVISVRDVVDFLVDHFPREVQNLPTEPGLLKMRTREGA
jgi:CBS domain-containing protein